MAASRGISQSASDTARMTNGFSRASGSIARVPAVAGNHATGVGQRTPPQLGNGPSSARGPDALRAAAQQSFDHRLAEADRLTELAKKTGNEQLSETADRMRLQAQQHFDAQVERADGMPIAADGQRPNTVTPATATSPVGVSANVPATTPTWRDRLHLATPFRR